MGTIYFRPTYLSINSELHFRVQLRFSSLVTNASIFIFILDNFLPNTTISILFPNVSLPIRQSLFYSQKFPYVYGNSNFVSQKISRKQSKKKKTIQSVIIHVFIHKPLPPHLHVRAIVSTDQSITSSTRAASHTAFRVSPSSPVTSVTATFWSPGATTLFCSSRPRTSLTTIAIE